MTSMITRARIAGVARQCRGVPIRGWVLIGLSACGGDRAPSGREYDSANVRVIEATSPMLADTGSWRVRAAPRVSIGVETGDDHYQFSRVGGIARLRDGRIVVGDGGSSQLRLFDSTGVFIAAHGTKGQGPGEFGEFSNLRIWRAPNGELLVNDSGNDRINIFDSSGTYQRAVKLGESPIGPRVFLNDVFADGTLLASAPEGGGRLNAEVVGPLAPMRFAYLRYSPAGEYLGTIVEVVDRQRYVNEFGTIRHFPYIPLTGEPKVVARGRTVLVYRGGAAEIEQWSERGVREATIRWRGAEPRSVESVWDRYVQESLDRMQGQQREQYQHYYRQPLPLPETVPAAEALLVDADDHLWIRRYRLPWETVQQWDIFSPDGWWLTTLETPDRLTVSQVGSDFVLGTHRDSLGVERVRLHELTRGSSSP